MHHFKSRKLAVTNPSPCVTNPHRRTPENDQHLCRVGRGCPRPFNHDCTGLTLDLSTGGVVAGQAQHVVRESWRAWCICKHIASGRRDADDADCFVHRFFSSINWKATRAFAHSCAAARAVCCGATLSPASLQGRLAGRPSLLCIWGDCQSVGTWDHIAWSCPHRPSCVPRPAKRCVARWGWAVTDQSPAERLAIQNWLIEVQLSLWRAFYGFADV